MNVGRFPISDEDGETSFTFKMPEMGRTMIIGLQMIADALILSALSYVALSFAMLLTYHGPGRIEYLTYLLPTVGTTLATVLTFARFGIYDPQNGVSILRVLGVTTKYLFQVICILIVLLFVLKISDNFSRLWLAIWAMTSVVALCGFRLVVARAMQGLMRAGRLTKNIAIVGANEIGHRLAATLVRESLGSRLVGIFDERQSRRVWAAGSGANVRPLAALEELLRAGEVDEIVVAISQSPSGRIFDLVRRFHPFPVSLRVLSPAGFEDFQVLDSRRYGDIGTFCIMGKPLDDAAIVLKRIEDFVIALVCLIAMLPLLVVVAISIKLDSPGPVFFRQSRLGTNNLPFELLKFRSMYVERSDPLGHQLTEADDPRITRVGRFIRRTSIDELPQLINVLRGNMSLVGPRPHALAASAAGIAYTRATQGYPIRHRVKPGITGWAQVNGWRGETVTLEQIRRRVDHDLYYIENWSLTFDLLILGWTLFTVLSRENAV